MSNNLWEERLQSIECKRKKEPLAVLLWGPAKESDKYWKREEIKKNLEACFPNVEVAYSEELLKQECPDDLFTDQVYAGLQHALAADVIIALEVSEGVLAEIAHYGSKKEIAKKLYILTPKEYNRKASPSFPTLLKRSLQKNEHIYFSEDEFNECTLAKKVCPSFIKREQYYRLASS